MKELNTQEAMQINGGWNICKICKQNVNGSWWAKYKHCLGHSSRCLPWEAIMDLAFGIWLK